MNPEILNPEILNPEILNPEILNPEILNPEILNPEILNPEILNPEILNPEILNPEILNPEILNAATTNAQMTDITWTVTNNGNTTFDLYSQAVCQQCTGRSRRVRLPTVDLPDPCGPGGEHQYLRARDRPEKNEPVPRAHRGYPKS